MIANELDLSRGNLVFHYKLKLDMLVELMNMLYEFQWQLMLQENMKKGSLRKD